MPTIQNIITRTNMTALDISSIDNSKNEKIISSATTTTTTTTTAETTTNKIDSSPSFDSYTSNNNNNKTTNANLLLQELWISYELIFNSKLMWLLIFGPLALIGDTTGLFGEALCFTCSGIALIPCAERLSFVTEQVATHTNGTIGALLNATFGNAPELLISASALRAGFYRVVQLAMLGSMLTNLLFVFGVSCLIGGIRWQVQELRITSGNVNIGMLLAATAGSLLPASLSYSGELKHHSKTMHQHQVDEYGYDMPTREELSYCRLNAFIMMILYISYLIFQLGTHKEEFDDDDETENENHHNEVDEHNEHHHHQQQHLSSPSKKTRKRIFTLAKRNKFCLRFWNPNPKIFDEDWANTDKNDEKVGLLVSSTPTSSPDANEKAKRKASDLNFDVEEQGSLTNSSSLQGSLNSLESVSNNNETIRRRNYATGGTTTKSDPPIRSSTLTRDKSHASDDYIYDASSNESINNNDSMMNGGGGKNDKTNGDGDSSVDIDNNSTKNAEGGKEEQVMSLRAGVFWLLIITMCVSAMSDILVDTIDGFAFRSRISEVFTSMVIIPFFSNIAEQVSAIIFAYHNKMDLCVGVTVGSAIQIALFVLPGCVLIGQAVDRSMTLYFKGFETCCLFFGVIVVAAILQGGTTNWLSGMILIGIYIMIASGIWFHELEDLSTDAEAVYESYQNKTTTTTSPEDDMNTTH